MQALFERKLADAVAIDAKDGGKKKSSKRSQPEPEQAYVFVGEQREGEERGRGRVHDEDDEDGDAAAAENNYLSEEALRELVLPDSVRDSVGNSQPGRSGPSSKQPTPLEPPPALAPESEVDADSNADLGWEQFKALSSKATGSSSNANANANANAYVTKPFRDPSLHVNAGLNLNVNAGAPPLSSEKELASKSSLLIDDADNMDLGVSAMVEGLVQQQNKKRAQSKENENEKLFPDDTQEKLHAILAGGGTSKSSTASSPVEDAELRESYSSAMKDYKARQAEQLRRMENLRQEQQGGSSSSSSSASPTKFGSALK